MKPPPTGEENLRASLRALHKQREARHDNPQPYDDDWGWWIETRLCEIEGQMKWLMRLALGVLAAEALRIALSLLGVV
jgi:hypothetical protein